MVAIYDFDTQLEIGQAVEARLMTHFRQFGEVRRADWSEQHRGIDFFCGTLSFEVKADSKTPDTGNVFVETVSVDTAGKPGWAYTSEADVLLYAVPAWQQTLAIEVARLRQHLPAWQGQYRSGTCRNARYRSVGLLIPYDSLRRIALDELTIG